ncbi:hypothetical protein CXB51_028481 [Gossypium anomalum]|uniref:Reverse transcriptase zinc-binding domain-containing protein n=1 Tax=Gossypium anomalum TaxID=47600 RepID=A0A8J5YAL5_9ROSI|nr:hypothetical protein CXB51_028481 [Gossypium anomalum]
MGLKWNVGTDESINIWEDCWVPRSLPGKVQTSRPSNIERVSELILPNGMAADAILIQGIPLPSVPQEDCLVWSGERSGIYSVRSGYRLLLQQPTLLSSRHDMSPENQPTLLSSRHDAFKKIWATRCPPKIKIALWKFVHGFVATRPCLYNRRVGNNPSCSRCNFDHETVNHVLRFCAKVRDVWVMLGYPLHVLSWILKMHHVTKHNEICVTMWAIWFARNRMSVGEIVSFIRSYCVEFVFVIHTNNGVVSDIQVQWSPPPARLNQKKAAAGVVIRDENGKILGACCKITYPVLSVFAAEVVAVIHELRFAKELDFLLGDSRSVIRKINNHEQDFYEVSILTWSANEIAKEFHACAFHFIGRSGNKTTHAIVQEGLSRGEDSYWVKKAPALVEAAASCWFSLNGCEDLIFKDSISCFGCSLFSIVNNFVEQLPIGIPWLRKR